MLRAPNPIPSAATTSTDLQAAESQSTLTNSAGSYYGNMVRSFPLPYQSPLSPLSSHDPPLSPLTNTPPQDIVLFGSDKEYTAAVMVGLTPAIESGTANTPEGALRRLLLATCDMLSMFIPKLGAHQRVIHGNNGDFDEDLVAGEVKR